MPHIDTDQQQEILRLLKENNRRLKSMHRHMRAGQLMDIIKVIAIIALIWVSYRIILPYIPQIQKTADDARQLQQQLQNGQEQLMQLESSLR